MLTNGEYGYTRPAPGVSRIEYTSRMRNYLDGSALSQTDGVVDVRVHSTLLGVDLNQAELRPDPFNEVVKAENGGVSQITTKYESAHFKPSSQLMTTV